MEWTNNERVIEQMLSSHNNAKKWENMQKLKENNETLKTRLYILKHEWQTDGQSNVQMRMS